MHIQLHLIRFYQSLLSSPDPRPYFVCSFSRSWFTITLSNTVLTLGDLVYMSMTLPIPKPFNLLNFCPAVIFPSPHTWLQSLHNLNFMHPPIFPSYPLAWSQLSSDPTRTFNQLIPPPFTVAHPFDVLTPLLTQCKISWPYQPEKYTQPGCLTSFEVHTDET